MDKKKTKFIEVKLQKMKLPIAAYLVKCPVCKRKILVEQGLIGVNHTAATFVTCWDCLTKEEKEKAKEKYKLEQGKNL